MFSFFLFLLSCEIITRRGRLSCFFKEKKFLRSGSCERVETFFLILCKDLIFFNPSNFLTGTNEEIVSEKKEELFSSELKNEVEF